jgi:aminoglycoside phosphotransferase (APT) family kinase protein
MAVAQGDFEGRLAAVLGRHIPGCRELLKAERLSGGASQETYRITVRTDDGDRLLCMRRAPGGIVIPAEERMNPGLATEALLMRCARDAGVPEPEVYHVLEPADELGEGFVMEWIEGEALGARIVRSPELAALRPRLAYECGKVLARIHSIDLERTGLGAKLKPSTPETYVRQTWERYQAFHTPQPMIDYAGRWLLEHLPENPRMALVHNDFRNGNFMVDPDGIVAVLDWEVAHVGDPMRDLGWICTRSWRFGNEAKPVGGFGDYADLFRGYEDESGIAVDPAQVKFWEVFGSFWWAIGCLGMAEHYRVGPDQTVERPGIGRRSSECQVDCANLLIPGPVSLVEPRDPQSSDEMPRIDELLISVRDFLRNDVMAATAGRLNFLSRVAGNSLDIVLRDYERGDAARRDELARLQALFGSRDDLSTLRWKLTNGLRDGSIPLDMPGLAEHLRITVVNQLAIDQPKYPALQTALAGVL